MGPMSLRNLPSSERAFATFVLLALAGFLAAGLVFTVRQERPARAVALPARSRLIAVLEGVMAPNTNPAQVAVYQTWVQGGATREGYPPVEAIVAYTCASCHGEGGQYPRLARYEDLRPWALDEASEGLYAEAAIALGRIGDFRLESRLIRLLRSPHVRTREAAAIALGNLPLA